MSGLIVLAVLLSSKMEGSILSLCLLDFPIRLALRLGYLTKHCST